MAVGRIGAGPRVAATLMATVVLTGVVAASGGAFDSPAPTTSTTTAGEPRPNSADQPAVTYLMLCYSSVPNEGQATSAVVAPVSERGELPGSVRIELTRSPQSRPSCNGFESFCARGLPLDPSGRRPSHRLEGQAVIEPTGIGSARLKVMTEDVDYVIAPITPIPCPEGMSSGTSVKPRPEVVKPSTVPTVESLPHAPRDSNPTEGPTAKGPPTTSKSNGQTRPIQDPRTPVSTDGETGK